MQIDIYCTYCLYPLHPLLSISVHHSASHIHTLMFGIRHVTGVGEEEKTVLRGSYTVRSESHCALRLRYVDLVVGIEVAVKVCCCFNVFSC
jgi:hypothetical protein